MALSVKVVTIKLECCFWVGRKVARKKHFAVTFFRTLPIEHWCSDSTNKIWRQTVEKRNLRTDCLKGKREISELHVLLPWCRLFIIHSSFQFPFFRYTCILCQEDGPLTPVASDVFVMAAYIQRSSVLSQLPSGPNAACDDLFLPMSLRCGPHTSSCGHAMHSECYHKFFRTLVQKEQERPAT